tara:strand:+ start:15388 stop:16095 length:708 start_codon:yes stop_codon:yes gene_type:complete
VQVDIKIGDSLTVMRELPDESQELIFTSPPYNLREKGIGSFPSKSGTWSNAKLKDGYPAHSDDLPYEDYREWQQECLREMWRLLAPNGAIFYNHKPRLKKNRLWHPLELNPDLPLRQIVIWYRNAGYNFHPRAFCNVHEYILIFAKPEWRMAKGKRGLPDVWSVPPARDNDHPAPFPVELPARAIEACAPKTVFDPFCGSGTTGVAAKLAGVGVFTGIELYEPYAAEAKARIETY